jgi:transposase-like protein
VYIDGIRLAVRDKGAVTVKVARLVIGLDVEGRKHALGCWIAEAEGAKFWLSVLIQLRNRGLRDILICCCDGLSGLPEAITTAFPQTVVQTCVVHVIRNAMKVVSYGDRKKVAAGMRAIYTASAYGIPRRSSSNLRSCSAVARMSRSQRCTSSSGLRAASRCASTHVRISAVGATPRSAANWRNSSIRSTGIRML